MSVAGRSDGERPGRRDNEDCQGRRNSRRKTQFCKSCSQMTHCAERMGANSVVRNNLPAGPFPIATSVNFDRNPLQCA